MMWIWLIAVPTALFGVIVGLAALEHRVLPPLAHRFTDFTDRSAL